VEQETALETKIPTLRTNAPGAVSALASAVAEAWAGVARAGDRVYAVAAVVAVVASDSGIGT